MICSLTEVALQLEENVFIGKVTRRALGPDGHVVGSYDENQFLNSMIYEVEFPDSQVDANGFSIHIMDGIVDCKHNDSQAISSEDMYVYNNHGTRKPQKITV
eukprot:13660238-Ditylum_brightwellii.AAC.1